MTPKKQAQTFGELRSLLNNFVDQAFWHKKCWALLNQVYDRAPQYYKAQWIPYLTAYPQCWSTRFEHAFDLPALARLVDMAPFARLGFTVSSNVKDDTARFDKVVRSPLLRYVYSLSLGSTHTLFSHHIHTLLADLRCTSLINLRVSGRNIDSNAALAIAQSDALHTLHRLEIPDSRVDDEGVIAIAQSTKLSHVNFLNLENNRLTDASAIALAQSTTLTSLRGLELHRNEIGPRGAKAIAQSPNFSSLTSLVLTHRTLTPEGKRALHQSPYLNEHIRSYFK